MGLECRCMPRQLIQYIDPFSTTPRCPGIRQLGLVESDFCHMSSCSFRTHQWTEWTCYGFHMASVHSSWAELRRSGRVLVAPSHSSFNSWSRGVGQILGPGWPLKVHQILRSNIPRMSNLHISGENHGKTHLWNWIQTWWWIPSLAVVTEKTSSTCVRTSHVLDVGAKGPHMSLSSPGLLSRSGF